MEKNNLQKIMKNKKYLFAIGRRKSAVARTRLLTAKEGKLEISINEENYKDYFPTLILQQIILQPLEKIAEKNKFVFTIKVKGGGKKGQAEAIRLSIARSLVLKDKKLKLILKSLGVLKRDSRVKERKKYGLKRARRAPQWQKR